MTDVSILELKAMSYEFWQLIHFKWQELKSIKVWKANRAFHSHLPYLLRNGSPQTQVRPWDAEKYCGKILGYEF